MSDDPADVFIPEVVYVRVLGEEAAWCMIRMPSMEVVVYVDFWGGDDRSAHRC
jgi:hypothetical protein